ncbi:MAG: hydroxymethylglutaryl-CoA lyase [Flammeovirgaceae bacterium]|nr:hydroxymethylglutaryl-CoA lyase [Flammeovirgaceae bacterium]
MKIIECPRHAMQGLTEFIPTEKKIEYINQLLKVGFDTIDFGSFVSAKAIPQLKDTAEVLASLDVNTTSSKLLAIVANTRGAEEASQYSSIHYLGFPLSISETFQQRNTNKSIAEALNTVREIQSICESSNQVLATYISMGFGNPYNDPYDLGVVEKFVELLANLQVKVISLADTIGVSQPTQINYLFTTLAKRFPEIEFGAHLHSNPATAVQKIEAAYLAGCRRFDGAIKGFGGCPMAEDELVGNLATETILSYLDQQSAAPVLNREALQKAMILADTVFPHG